MKRIFLYLLLLAACVSCKQNDWVDWKAQNEAFLLDNKTKPGIQTTATGLQYRVLYEGNVYDVRPNTTSTIKVDYTLKLINGYVIEQSNDVTLSMSTVIDGFAEGLRKIHVHGDVELYIPWDIGYGKDGSGTEGTISHIPPYSTLLYTVHLSAVNN